MISGLLSFCTKSWIYSRSFITHIIIAYLNCYLRTFTLNVATFIPYGENIVYWCLGSIKDALA